MSAWRVLVLLLAAMALVAFFAAGQRASEMDRSPLVTIEDQEPTLYGGER